MSKRNERSEWISCVRFKGFIFLGVFFFVHLGETLTAGTFVGVALGKFATGGFYIGRDRDRDRDALMNVHLRFIWNNWKYTLGQVHFPSSCWTFDCSFLYLISSLWVMYFSFYCSLKKLPFLCCPFKTNLLG